jgi:hypothetical protein
VSKPRKVASLVVLAGVLAVSVAAVALAGFKPAASYPVGAEALDVVIGNLGGNANRDLAVSNRADNDVSLLLGNGKGAFLPAKDLPAGPEPNGLLVRDFNGDGRQDLAVANQSAVGGVTILLRKGSGFSSRHYPAGPESSIVVAGRFTADRRLDLAVSNLEGSTVSILRGKADGKFVKMGDLPTGQFPFALTVGDFNRDGKLDVAVINDKDEDETQISVFRGDGDGTFKTPLNTPAGQGDDGVVVSRFNGDSIPDLAVADYSNDQVLILIGKGDGRFRAPKPFAAGGHPSEIALGDFTGDGLTDLAVTNAADPGRVAILPRRPGVDFGNPLKYPVGSLPYGIAVGNLNGDALPDVATANYTGTTSVLQGN